MRTLFAKLARRLAERAEAKGRPYAALKRWRRLAAHGDAGAAFRIACLYESGQGVVRDLLEAAHWHREAAERGHAPAQLRIGRLLINGARAPLPAKVAPTEAAPLFPHGVELKADPLQAVAFLTKAAESGEAEACVLLGALYYEGRKVPRDLTQARRWYEQGARAGAPQAQFGLGDLLFNAGETKPAAVWYEKAAEQGHARAQTAMGYLNQHGLGRERDLAAAGAWYGKAAAQGELHALDAAARMHLSGEGLPANATQAETFWRAAAKRGHLPAMIALADLYERNGDLREATHWRVAAADAGHVESQFRAAQALSAGPHVNEAARHYAAAAAAGHALAAFNLGALIARNPLNDPAEALPWYKQAAEAGIAAAFARLADLYLDETLSIHDSQAGREWLAKAAATDKNAKARYALLLLKTDQPESLAEAEKLLLEVAGPDQPAACHALADLHARGLAADARPEAALRWFSLAAEGGHAESRYLLAVATLSTNPAAAVATLRELAESGHAAAQFQLGVLLSAGRSAPADLRAAAAWYRKASASGHALAQYNLGVMLTQGLGTPADVAEGMRLIAEAADRGVTPKQSTAA